MAEVKNSIRPKPLETRKQDQSTGMFPAVLTPVLSRSGTVGGPSSVEATSLAREHMRALLGKVTAFKLGLHDALKDLAKGVQGTYKVLDSEEVKGIDKKARSVIKVSAQEQEGNPAPERLIIDIPLDPRLEEDLRIIRPDVEPSVALHDIIIDAKLRHADLITEAVSSQMGPHMHSHFIFGKHTNFNEDLSIYDEKQQIVLLKEQVLSMEIKQEEYYIAYHLLLGKARRKAEIISYLRNGLYRQLLLLKEEIVHTKKGVSKDEDSAKIFSFLDDLKMIEEADDGFGLRMPEPEQIENIYARKFARLEDEFKTKLEERDERILQLNTQIEELQGAEQAGKRRLQAENAALRRAADEMSERLRQMVEDGGLYDEQADLEEKAKALQERELELQLQIKEKAEACAMLEMKNQELETNFNHAMEAPQRLTMELDILQTKYSNLKEDTAAEIEDLAVAKLRLEKMVFGDGQSRGLKVQSEEDKIALADALKEVEILQHDLKLAQQANQGRRKSSAKRRKSIDPERPRSTGRPRSPTGRPRSALRKAGMVAKAVAKIKSGIRAPSPDSEPCENCQQAEESVAQLKSSEAALKWQLVFLKQEKTIVEMGYKFMKKRFEKHVKLRRTLEEESRNLKIHVEQMHDVLEELAHEVPLDKVGDDAHADTQGARDTIPASLNPGEFMFEVEPTSATSFAPVSSSNTSKGPGQPTDTQPAEKRGKPTPPALSAMEMEILYDNVNAAGSSAIGPLPQPVASSPTSNSRIRLASPPRGASKPGSKLDSKTSTMINAEASSKGPFAAYTPEDEMPVTSLWDALGGSSGDASGNTQVDNTPTVTLWATMGDPTGTMPTAVLETPPCSPAGTREQPPNESAPSNAGPRTFAHVPNESAPPNAGPSTFAHAPNQTPPPNAGLSTFAHVPSESSPPNAGLSTFAHLPSQSSPANAGLSPPAQAPNRGPPADARLSPSSTAVVNVHSNVHPVDVAIGASDAGGAGSVSTAGSVSAAGSVDSARSANGVSNTSVTSVSNVGGANTAGSAGNAGSAGPFSTKRAKPPRPAQLQIENTSIGSGDSRASQGGRPLTLMTPGRLLTPGRPLTPGGPLTPRMELVKEVSEWDEDHVLKKKSPIMNLQRISQKIINMKYLIDACKGSVVTMERDISYGKAISNQIRSTEKTTVQGYIDHSVEETPQLKVAAEQYQAALGSSSEKSLSPVAQKEIMEGISLGSVSQNSMTPTSNKASSMASRPGKSPRPRKTSAELGKLGAAAFLRLVSNFQKQAEEAVAMQEAEAGESHEASQPEKGPVLDQKSTERRKSGAQEGKSASLGARSPTAGSPASTTPKTPWSFVADDIDTATVSMIQSDVIEIMAEEFSDPDENEEPVTPWSKTSTASPDFGSISLKSTSPLAALEAKFGRPNPRPTHRGESIFANKKESQGAMKPSVTQWVQTDAKPECREIAVQTDHSRPLTPKNKDLKRNFMRKNRPQSALETWNMKQYETFLEAQMLLDAAEEDDDSPLVTMRSGLGYNNSRFTVMDQASKLMTLLSPEKEINTEGMLRKLKNPSVDQQILERDGPRITAPIPYIDRRGTPGFGGVTPKDKSKGPVPKGKAVIRQSPIRHKLSAFPRKKIPIPASDMIFGDLVSEHEESALKEEISASGF